MQETVKNELTLAEDRNVPAVRRDRGAGGGQASLVDDLLVASRPAEPVWWAARPLRFCRKSAPVSNGEAGLLPARIIDLS